MKVECQREKLRTAVNLAERITGRNLSLPVLAKIYLQATDRALVIRATNLDLGLEFRLPAKIEQTGEVLVSGVVLGNFLANLTGEEKMKLELVGKNLAVTTTRHSTLIKTEPVDDFPTLPQLAGPGLPVKASDLLTGLRSVAYAAALNDIKPEIASVYLHGDDHGLYFVATDSFRLAQKKLAGLTKIDSAIKLIIPIRNVAELIRLLEQQADNEVTLAYNQHQLSLTADQWYLTSRLIDGLFPDYQQLLPNKSQTQISMEKDELLGALKLANVFTDRLNHVTFKLRPEDQMLEINSQNSDTGENTTTLPVAITGEELTINFNLRYLLEGLQSIAGGKIFLQFNGRTKPIYLSGGNEASFHYLIMPLNR